ncbi:MAG: hypothetical protein ABIQ16_17315 [Polyangiaceae bacterium]
MREVVPSADLESTYLVNGFTADGSAAFGTRLSNTRTSGDFQWTRSGGVRDLPPLNAPDGVNAFGQSKDGRLVAGSSGANALLWDAAGVRDVGAELRSTGVDLQGWGSYVARGVTAAHSVIAYGSASKSVSRSSSPEARVNDHAPEQQGSRHSG